MSPKIHVVADCCHQYQLLYIFMNCQTATLNYLLATLSIITVTLLGYINSLEIQVFKQNAVM